MLKIGSIVRVKDDCSLKFGSYIGTVEEIILDSLLPVGVALQPDKHLFYFDEKELELIER